MVPDSLRYVPQVKSDIIIQRREVSMAPVEGMNVYQRDATNTITFNVQGHKTTNQLMDSKSLYFTWHCKFKNGYPVEDVSNLIEEVIISSNGRVLERIRHFQYIQWYLKQYEMSRTSKRRLGKREGYSKYEDESVQFMSTPIAKYEAKKADGTQDPVAANRRFVTVAGDHGFKNSETGFADDAPIAFETPMFDNLGYYYEQRNRNFNTGAGKGEPADGWPKKGSEAVAGNLTDGFGYKLMKFRIKASGLLSCDKMLPIGFCPLTVQFRLSDKMRCTDKGDKDFDYAIKRPRMHFSVCTCGQAYASALQQRLRGPGITLNMKLFDTFFQIIKEDKQIVIPSNKQRLSKVYLMLHDEEATTNPNMNAFRSSVCGTNTVQYGLKSKDKDGNVTDDSNKCLQSYQFQVGTEVSEPVTLEDTSKGLSVYTRDNALMEANPNSGMAFLEAYLKSIGAVNGHEQDVEYWGRNLDPNKCKDHEGGDLLQTFLHRYFVAVYDGEKFLGTEIESGVDTEAGKDIVCDLRWKGGAAQRNVRVMALIQYHAQMIIKENSVEMSY